MWHVLKEGDGFFIRTIFPLKSVEPMLRKMASKMAF
jgi:hypothetical protein